MTYMPLISCSPVLAVIMMTSMIGAGARSVIDKVLSLNINIVMSIVFVIAIYTKLHTPRFTMSNGSIMTKMTSCVMGDTILMKISRWGNMCMSC